MSWIVSAILNLVQFANPVVGPEDPAGPITSYELNGIIHIIESTEHCRFGVPAEVVSANRLMAYRWHIWVQNNRWRWENDPGLFDLICADAQWRYRCWDLLDDCFRWGHAMIVHEKLRYLRQILGDVDYAFGLMPAPIPAGIIAPDEVLIP